MAAGAVGASAILVAATGAFELLLTCLLDRLGLLRIDPDLNGLPPVAVVLGVGFG
jgi:hypothetical protein